MFSGCSVLFDSQKTKPGNSNQEAYPSAGKNTGVVLVLCHAKYFISTATSSGLNIPEVPGYHLLQQMSSQ